MIGSTGAELYRCDDKKMFIFPFFNSCLTIPIRERNLYILFSSYNFREQELIISPSKELKFNIEYITHFTDQ